MLKAVMSTFFRTTYSLRFCLGFVLLTTIPVTSSSEIIWSGDYSTGNFKQWHSASDPNLVAFFQVPEYGRPIQYGYQSPIHVGDGSLLSLVSVDGRTINGITYPQGPTRGADYAAKITVKNSINGSEPADCDNGICTRRRTELTVQQTLSDYYNALPYMSERWVSFSVYIPSDWDFGGSGWGPVLFQIKPRNESGSSGLTPMLSIGLPSANNWTIYHHWSGIENPTMEEIPWQQMMFYAGDEGGSPYPRADNWPDGLADFPDIANSHAALRNVNVGGWTDWIMHIKFDARGSDSGGQGFINVWKRENSADWVQVLRITPKKTTRGGVTFDHGVGYNAPPRNSDNGGFGVKAGMYLTQAKVWNLREDRVIYNANVKVGDETTGFAEMSHDGSVPGFLPETGISPPKAPSIAPLE